MIKKIKNLIKDFYLKKGLKTNHQYVIFESDDWGTIRSTKKGIASITQKYPNKKLDSYQLNDCLETEEDLLDLFNVLLKHRDNKGNNPIFMANYIMKNPILRNGNIELEEFSETLKDTNVIAIIKDNLNKKIFIPQLHGLIHFEYDRLVEDIKKHQICLDGLKNSMIGLSDDDFFQGMATYSNQSHNSITEACNIFEKTFGYKSKSFIFPCYMWNKINEKELKENGINIIQGGLFQYTSKNSQAVKRKLHYMAQKNSFNQRYFIRNCNFEPTKYAIKGIDIEQCLKDCLYDIAKAFKNKKPAIICTHRCNYVGGMNKKNKEDNLLLLDKLLTEILIKYPECRFTTTYDLNNVSF